MARKQVNTKQTAAEGAVSAPRSAKGSTARTRTSKHSKAVSSDPVTAAFEEPFETAEEVEIFVAPVVSAQSSIDLESNMEPDRQPEVNAQPGGQAPDGKARQDENAHEAIAKIAYSYWVARGYRDENPLQDWVRAEEEYRQQSLVAAAR
jgi:hypothetical protein